MASDVKIAALLYLFFFTRVLIRISLFVRDSLRLCHWNSVSVLSHISCFRCPRLTLLQLRRQGENPSMRCWLHNVSLLLAPKSHGLIYFSSFLSQLAFPHFLPYLPTISPLSTTVQLSVTKNRLKARGWSPASTRHTSRPLWATTECPRMRTAMTRARLRPSCLNILLCRWQCATAQRTRTVLSTSSFFSWASAPCCPGTSS